jgi:ketol-acid reductoisomerase
MSAAEVVIHKSDTPEHAVLAERTIAVIGYGHLGRSVALNLRDSGVAVLVGNIEDEFRPKAVEDGFDVVSIAAASEAADLVWLLIPDEEIPDVFENDVAPNLSAGDAVCFGSGYVLAFGLIETPEHVDVLLLAPRMLGEEVRRTYVDGSGFFSFVSLEQDASGTGHDVLLGLASAVGSLRRGAMVLSAEQEALLDLMVEQTVGPVLGGALITAFHAGVDAGLPAEAMVLELYMSGEMARTFATFASEGLYRSATWHGLVAQYGGYLHFGDVDLDAMDGVFRETIQDIRSGRFARGLQDQRQQGFPTMQAIEAMTAGSDPITQAERNVRRFLGESAT